MLTFNVHHVQQKKFESPSTDYLHVRELFEFIRMKYYDLPIIDSRTICIKSVNSRKDTPKCCTNLFFYF